jgi:hypothetical protein
VQSELNGWLSRLELELAALLNARVLGRKLLVCSRVLFTANNRMLCRSIRGSRMGRHKIEPMLNRFPMKSRDRSYT